MTSVSIVVYAWAARYEVAECNRLAKTLQAWEPDCSPTRLTNGSIEGRNRIIKPVSARASAPATLSTHRVRVSSAACIAGLAWLDELVSDIGGIV